MSAEFIDSNVFVYLFDEVDDRKREAASRLVDNALEAGTGVISFQVVQETLHVILRKLPTPATGPDATDFMEQVLTPLWRVMPSTAIYRQCIEIQSRYRYGFYDSLIIAAALEAGCRTLYSEDMQHGQRIEQLTIRDPFVSA